MPRKCGYLWFIDIHIVSHSFLLHYYYGCWSNDHVITDRVLVEVSSSLGLCLGFREMIIKFLKLFKSPPRTTVRFVMGCFFFKFFTNVIFFCFRCTMLRRKEERSSHRATMARTRRNGNSTTMVTMMTIMTISSNTERSSSTDTKLIPPLAKALSAR